MQLGELTTKAAEFGAHLAQVKASVEPPSVGWYPGMLPGHVEMLDRLLVGEPRRVLEEPTGRPIADVGAADGDLGFFLDSVGFDIDLFDGPQRPGLLKDALGARASSNFVDLDHDFELPRKYEMVFFLHVLYHLRNPMLALETLARWTQYCVFSTRVSDNLVPGRLARLVNLGRVPAAYLLDPGELNPHDSLNFWVFTQAGLARVLARTGWEVLSQLSVGNEKAGPGDPDQLKVWCALRSKTFSWST